MNSRKYCIPLTSPKDKFKNKKSQVVFIKVFDGERRDENGQFKLIGVLNINNMIPVDDRYIKKVNHPDKNHNLVKRSSKFDKLEALLDKLLKKD